MGLIMMKCIVLTQGPKIRVNVMPPSLLPTKRFCEISAHSQTGPESCWTLLDDCVEAYIPTTNTPMTRMAMMVGRSSCLPFTAGGGRLVCKFWVGDQLAFPVAFQ